MNLAHNIEEYENQQYMVILDAYMDLLISFPFELRII